MRRYQQFPPTPTAATDAANKGYVDGAVGGLTGLLTGGSIRKIWAAFFTKFEATEAALKKTSALIFDDKFAIIPLFYNQAYVSVGFLSPQENDTPSFFTTGIRYSQASVTGPGMKISGPSTYPDLGITTPQYLNKSSVSTAIPSDFIGILGFESNSGFVYAD